MAQKVIKRAALLAVLCSSCGSSEPSSSADRISTSESSLLAVNQDPAASSIVAAISLAPSTMHVFTRGSDNALWLKFRMGDWAPWQSLGAPPGASLSSGPAVAQTNAYVGVYVRASDSAIWYRTCRGLPICSSPTDWSAWKSLGSPGGPVDSSPAVGRQYDKIQVFVRGAGDALFQRPGDASAGWQRLDTMPLQSSPALSQPNDSSVELVALANQRIVRGRFDGSWSSWLSTSLPGFGFGGLAAAPVGGDGLDIFARKGSEIWRAMGSSWLPFSEGPISSVPAVLPASSLAGDPDRPILFARMQDNIVRYTTDGAVWTSLPDPPAAPSALTLTPSAFSVALRWQDNSNAENGFRIQRRVGTSGTLEILATVPSNPTTGAVSYVDESTKPNTDYCYSVVALGSRTVPSSSVGGCTHTPVETLTTLTDFQVSALAFPPSNSALATKMVLARRQADGSIQLRRNVLGAWGPFFSESNQNINGTSAGGALFLRPPCVGIIARNADYEPAWMDCQFSPTSLGMRTTAAPNAVGRDAQSFDVFARSVDTKFRRWTQAGGWEDLGGGFLSAPASMIRSDGKYDIFGIGLDNALWHRTPDSTWQSLGGNLTSAPAVAAGANNDFDVYARATDRQLYRRTATSGWRAIPGEVRSAPAVARLSDGLHVFATDSNNQPVESINAGAWQTVPFDAPLPASDLRASTSQTTIRLTWTDNATNEDSYRIYDCASASGTLLTNLAAHPGTGEMSYEVPGLTPDKGYCFAVYVFAGRTLNSTAITARTSTFPAPIAPSNVFIVSKTISSLTIQFRDNDLHEDVNRVVRSDGRVVCEAPHIGTGTVNCTDSSLNPNSVYCYRAEAVSSAGVSRSDPVCGPTNAPWNVYFSSASPPRIWDTTANTATTFIQSGRPFRVEWQVCGTALSAPFQTPPFVNQLKVNGTLASETGIGSLDTCRNESLAFPNGALKGVYAFEVTLDARNQVPEVNEADNQRTVQLTVD